MTNGKRESSDTARLVPVAEDLGQDPEFLGAAMPVADLPNLERMLKSADKTGTEVGMVCMEMLGPRSSKKNPKRRALELQTLWKFCLLLFLSFSNTCSTEIQIGTNLINPSGGLKNSLTLFGDSTISV